MSESTRRWSGACLAAIVALALSACRGSGTAPSSGFVPTDTSRPLPGIAAELQPAAIGPVNLYPGAIIGIDDKFGPKDGDTKTGGTGQTVGRVRCDVNEHVNNYHVHLYLGVIYQGRQMAVPDAIGMVNPGAEDNGYINNAQCYYWIHTHDASGLIHIESPSNVPPSSVVYKFNYALNIWGVPHSSTQFGPFHGGVKVYTGNVPLKTTVVSKYSAWTKGDYSAIPMKSHEVIWIEIGKPFVAAKNLPSVTFYSEY